MMSRITTRLLAGTAGVAILVAACGSGTASTAPTAAPATPTAAPVVTQAPGATAGPGATFDLASFHADVQLEELLPDSIGGVTLVRISLPGTALMGEGSSPELQAMLSALNKTPADLSAAIASGAAFQLFAFQIDGAPGSSILDALFDAYAASTASIVDATFGGKQVKKITSDGDISYVYAAQDVVFVVAGDEITDAILNEIFSKLP